MRTSLDTSLILSDWLAARLDRARRRKPVYRNQTLRLMQQAILTGHCPAARSCPGFAHARPSDLGIARNTVLHVYDQLTAEGYIRSRPLAAAHIVADTSAVIAAGRNERRAKKPVSLASVDAQGSPCQTSQAAIKRDLGDRLRRGRKPYSIKQRVSAKLNGVRSCRACPTSLSFRRATWSRLQAKIVEVKAKSRSADPMRRAAATGR